VNFEGPGIIADWTKSRGYEMSFTRFYLGENLPKVKDIDLLVIMGGPMSFDEFDKYPWLKDEILFIKEVINANRAILGICLGAQLLVKALGSRALHGNKKEIGWFPVYFDNYTLKETEMEFIPEEITVFHWHTDTFEIPRGAIHLARSKAFPNQAFIYKRKVIGLQFHFEVKRDSVIDMVSYGRQELEKSDYVQSAAEILNNSGHIENSNKIMTNILDKLEKELHL
jgi:GMP synthase (glutamine-hydrolysing)